jgi:hypothetical protein
MTPRCSPYVTEAKPRVNSWSHVEREVMPLAAVYILVGDNTVDPSHGIMDR